MFHCGFGSLSCHSSEMCVLPVRGCPSVHLHCSGPGCVTSASVGVMGQGTVMGLYPGGGGFMEAAGKD